MNRDNVKIILKGMWIGGTMTVPGVSGGSMAMIMGVYDRLISSISSFFKEPAESMAFLLKFVLGAGTGMVLFSRFISYLFTTRADVPLRFFFLGAVAGGVPMIYREAGVKKLDLGAVAKGRLGEVLSQDLKELGVTSALLELGGNIQTVGTKPDGSRWRVGIQDPDSQEGGYLAIVEVADQAVVTSGDYQRYFEENGQRYCHIMDPATAAPADSGVDSVTVVGSDGTVCDALSTALYVMGEEKGAQFWKDHPELNFEAIFVSQDGSIAVTAGLEDHVTLADGYQDREVTVIER